MKAGIATAAALVAGLSLSIPVTGAAESASCAGSIPWSRAASVTGRTATVRGPVVGSHFARSSHGSPTFLNLGRDYPDPRRVTVIIWLENRSAFGSPETRYLGRTICVRGEVTLYRGVPEIEARTPSQIAVAG